MTTKHTPGPWTRNIRRIVGADGREVCRIQSINIGAPGAPKYDSEIPKANAEFIVRACNSHADLLAALESLQAALDACSEPGLASDHTMVLLAARDNAAEVIAKARGEA